MTHPPSRLERLEARQLLATLPPLLVKDINPNAASSAPPFFQTIRPPTPVRLPSGDLLFSADDGQHGYELWRSDGSSQGTRLVLDIFPGSTGSEPAQLTRFGETAYFSARTSTHGIELWKTNGTPEGTLRVTDINPGAADAAPGNFTVLNGVLYFTATDPAHGRELWKLGPSGAPALVKDINPGTRSSLHEDAYSFQRIVYNNRLFFTANDGPADDPWNTDLWSTDGTESNTQPLKQLNALAPGADVEFTIVNNTLFFAVPAPTLGRTNTLWKSDGTAPGTAPVLNDPELFAYNPMHLTAVADTLYFSADTTRNLVAEDRELYRSDGSHAGTTIVKDIVPGPIGSNPSQLHDHNGTLFLLARDNHLYKSDGSSDGTISLATFSASGSVFAPYADEFTSVGPTLYFRANHASYGYELWQSQGTPQSTTLVADLKPGPAGSEPADLVNAGGTLYFRAEQSPLGRELWKLPAPDTTPPAIVSTSFDNDTLPQRLLVHFSEDVRASVTEQDFSLSSLLRDIPTIPLRLLSYDTNTHTAILTPRDTDRLSDDRYVLALPAANVTDAAGNLLASDFSFHFFHLTADANNDATVDSADFLILHANFAKTDDARFSQGDFNYDRRVTFADFQLLESRFNQSLPPVAPPAARPSSAHTFSARRPRRRF